MLVQYFALDLIDSIRFYFQLDTDDPSRKWLPLEFDQWRKEFLEKGLWNSVETIAAYLVQEGEPRREYPPSLSQALKHLLAYLNVIREWESKLKEARNEGTHNEKG